MLDDRNLSPANDNDITRLINQTRVSKADMLIGLEIGLLGDRELDLAAARERLEGPFTADYLTAIGCRLTAMCETVVAGGHTGPGCFKAADGAVTISMDVLEAAGYQTLLETGPDGVYAFDAMALFDEAARLAAARPTDRPAGPPALSLVPPVCDAD